MKIAINGEKEIRTLPVAEEIERVDMLKAPPGHYLLLIKDCPVLRPFTFIGINDVYACIRFDDEEVNTYIKTKVFLNDLVYKDYFAENAF